MATVVLDKIRKAYETKVAVEGLSLRIEPGTMFGLLGPNGSGKTSSIRMMIGITVPDSGTVALFNKPFEREALKRVGYLPEERGLYKKMNVLEQITFMGQLRGLSVTEAEKRGKLWAERLQITEALPKKTEELSKGMQQKIQFITALIHEPELIIMDEPFSGLDPVNGALLQDTLLQLRAEGKTILFSTHRMDQVEKMCDAIALIHRGRIVLEGNMREIKSRYPKNRVEVTFEGDNSFLSNSVVESSEEFGGGIASVKLRGDGITMMPDAQPLLAEAVARGTRISRFEVKEPTLEEIFIERVGGNADV
jgi:ABC-2 type transport system ATP-binding protein